MANFLDLASKAVKRISRSARIETVSDASLMKEYLRKKKVGGGRQAGVNRQAEVGIEAIVDASLMTKEYPRTGEGGGMGGGMC